MQNFKKISVITVNYKSQECLKSCLDSVCEKLPAGRFEIIVVNNDEDSIHPDFSSFENLKIIENGKNIGFGSAANLGAEEARGEWLLFLNPDARLLTDQSKILDFLEKNENVGIASPLLVGKDGKARRWSAGKEMSLVRLILDNAGKIAGEKAADPERPAEVGWVSGAAMFVRKNIFEELGGFDENIFMYFEDMDICKRARQRGKKIVYFPQDSVEHIGGKSVRDAKKQKKDYYESQDYYFRKHHGKLRSAIVKYLRKFFAQKHA